MPRGTSYLVRSLGRAAVAANARTPFATEGPASVPSFVFGLPASELAAPLAAAFGASTLAGIARGVHRSRSGKLGLALTAGAAVSLLATDARQNGTSTLVDLALDDALGAGHRSDLAPDPLEPTRTVVDLLPTKTLRSRYVESGHVAYGDFGRRTTLDVWRRPDLPLDGSAPVLVQVHGGAWVLGDKEGQAYPLMAYLAERGWVCVSVTYRLSPRATWPDHIVDVKRALAWVKEHIASHGGDPNWVAITGGSAGGHLASLAALTPNDPQFQPGFEDADTSVRAAVPFYGVYDWTNRDGSGRDDISDLLEQRIVKATAADRPEVYDQASPMSHIGADAPPTLFIHGSMDSLVPVTQARSMVDQMRAASRQPVGYLELPGAQHAFDIFGSRRTKAVVEGVHRFLSVIRTRNP